MRRVRQNVKRRGLRRLRKRVLRRVRRMRRRPMARPMVSMPLRPEKKRLDVQVFNGDTINNVQARFNYITTGITNGTANNQRIGSKVTIRSIAMHIQFETNSPNDNIIYFDVYLLVHKPGSGLTGAQILEAFMDPDPVTGNFTTRCYRDQYEFQDFAVYKKRRLYIRPTIVSAQNYVESWIKWRGATTVTYDAGGISNNAIGVLVVSSPNLTNTADPACVLNSRARIFFTDD